MSELKRGVRGWWVASAFFLGACGGEVPPALERPEEPARLASASAGAALRTGYLLNPDGSPRRIAYEERGGQAIIEGDIVVGPADAVASTSEQAVEWARTLGQQSGALKASGSRWPGGVVYYYIDPNISFPSAVTAAMEHIGAETAAVERYHLGGTRLAQTGGQTPGLLHVLLLHEHHRAHLRLVVSDAGRFWTQGTARGGHSLGCRTPCSAGRGDGDA